MYAKGEDVFYNITIYNENYPQPAMPDGDDVTVPWPCLVTFSENFWNVNTAVTLRAWLMSTGHAAVVPAHDPARRAQWETDHGGARRGTLGAGGYDAARPPRRPRCPSTHRLPVSVPPVRTPTRRRTTP